MKNNIFKKLIEEIDEFNNHEFRLLKEKVEQRIYSKRVSYILETPLSELNCPFCTHSNFIKWGKRSDLQRYKCKNCRKTFNSLTKTPLSRLRRKGHWLDYSNCLKQGYTVRRAAAECGINKNTSFRWRHRFLTNSKFIKAEKLGGIVEKTHLKLKESFKGSRDKILLNKKRKNVFILYAVDRNHNLFDITNKGFSFSVVKRAFRNVINKDSLVLSEKNQQFIKFAKQFNYRHTYLSSDSRKLTYSTYSEKYKNLFLEWVNNRFRGVATKYLENYVAWYRARNEFKSGIKAITILYRAKSIEKYRHQPLKMTRFI
ncbi:MAG: hypothetical protein N4A49_08570 [Marinifilaceae bacterium]|nr:hypothetical protein [Marinifilaceae bacterium]